MCQLQSELILGITHSQYLWIRNGLYLQSSFCTLKFFTKLRLGILAHL